MIDESRSQLIHDSISFMTSLVHHYGQEKGMAAWEKMADFCDPNLKGEIFMVMLTGDFSNRVTVTGVQDGANAVSCIKAIRSVDNRRLGLKEAKDLYDGLRFNSKKFNLEIDNKARGRVVKELRDAGFVI